MFVRYRITLIFLGLVFLGLPAGVFAGARKARDNAALNESSAGLQQRGSAENPAENSASVSADKTGQSERILVYFFYEELCELCHYDEEKFISILNDRLPLADRDKFPNFIQILNVYNSGGRMVFTRVCEEMDLDKDTISLPFMVLGGKVFQGYDSISANIREAYFAAGEELFAEH